MPSTITPTMCALYCVLSVLRDAPRADRRILFGAQLDAQDVDALRTLLTDGWETSGTNRSDLADWGYALCTSEDAVANGSVDIRYTGTFASDSGDSAPVHGVFGRTYRGHSVPLPVHESQVHSGDAYVSLPGDSFAGEPLRSGTLVSWDPEIGTHYPAGPAHRTMWRGQYGIGSLVHVLFGTGLYRVVEGYCPEDTTVAIVPVAQGMRGPVLRAPLVNVRPHVGTMGSTWAPRGDIELGETITDLVADAADIGGLSLWDMMRATGHDCDHVVSAMLVSEELAIARDSVSHGAALYIPGPARRF